MILKETFGWTSRQYRNEIRSVPEAPWKFAFISGDPCADPGIGFRWYTGLVNIK